MTKIGLVPMAAKPYHAGHDGLVRIAASECDEVRLFVSLSDRKRPGEMPILGSSMRIIWDRFLKPGLPSNVVVSYVSIPVTEVYKALEAAEAAGEQDTTFLIYSDDEDITKYTDKSLEKSAPTLFAESRIIRRGVSRSETVPVSGTKMREFMASGDARSFARYLPPAVQDHAEEILGILKGDFVNESLIKSYVRLLLSSRSKNLF